MEITTHVVKKKEPVKVTVLDIRGPGGASHDYLLEAGIYRREINFQNGPLNVNGANGITDEALLAIVIDRMEGFQGGPLKCEENADALLHLRRALEELQARTVTRMEQGVEGQYLKHEAPAPPEPDPDPPEPQAPPFKPTKKATKKVAKKK